LQKQKKITALEVFESKTLCVGDKNSMNYQTPTLTAVARENRLEIALYYDTEVNLERADRFVEATEITIRDIQKNPYQGRVYEENGKPYDGKRVRRIPMSRDSKGSRYPYFFIYRILSDSLLVLRIQGERQDDFALNED
jgi:plasmid stabilization system protein ParE